MARINWSPIYSVNVALLDDQHKTVIDLINKAYDHAGRAISSEEAGKFFNEAEADMKNHFITEEGYMDKFGCDGAEAHKKEHAKFSQKLSELKREYEQKGDGVVMYKMIEALEEYILVHILEFDKKYIACFNGHGLR